MRDLWPPLHEIERRTRPVPDGLSLVDNPIAHDLSGDHLESSPPLPDFLSSLIERGTAANRQASALREGAVVLYTPEPKDKPGLAPFAFCLNRLLSRQGQNEKWLGWVASPDVDYAGPYDVVLEPHDEPFDPFAGMIQTWNPLVLTLRAPMRLLAQLSTDRVRLMRAVEQQAVSGGGNASPSRPGHIELRSIGPESILTGTMLGGSTDPRTQYAAIYRALASEFQPRAANDGSWFGMQRKQWYGIAATVVAGIGALVIYGNIEQASHPETTVASRDSATTIVAKAEKPDLPSPTDANTQQSGTGSVSPSALTKPEESVGQARDERKAKQSFQPPTQVADATGSGKQSVPSEAAKVPRDTSVVTPAPSIPQAMPILLASLDEAKYAIPLVRSANRTDALKSAQDMPLASPTHVLRITDRKSVALAIDILAKLGITATQANSPVPAVVFALPANMSAPGLEEKLVGNEVFVPRSAWLK